MEVITNRTKTKSVKAHHHPCKLMGCGFVLTAVHADPQIAWDAIRAAETEIVRIERLVSSWKATSQTSMINRMSGVAPVVISKELYDLISRSIKISELTSGAFDISGTLSRYYWQFDKTERSSLDLQSLEELRYLMDYHNIDLDPQRQSVYLKKKGMKIGFGGIGKGYAAARAKKVMLEHGIASGLINASGDLVAWGNAPGQPDWNINIPHPDDRNRSLLTFSIPHGSVVTSGNFENYTLINGVKYSHIVDPRTAYPVRDVKHVSVISPDPEFADAMATAISVMGIKEGINVVNMLNGIECIMIDRHDKVHYSNHLKNNMLCKN